MIGFSRDGYLYLRRAECPMKEMGLHSDGDIVFDGRGGWPEKQEMGCKDRDDAEKIVERINAILYAREVALTNLKSADELLEAGELEACADYLQQALDHLVTLPPPPEGI